MIFSVQQGHCLSDAAQCVAVSAGDLSVRGHRWYTAGIWDEIITALVLIEAFIPGVIRAKQTTLGSSKTQLGLWGELWAEMQCAASSLSAETNTWWKSLISLPVAATNCLYFVQDYYGVFLRNIIGYNIQILCGLWKKKKRVERHDGQFQMGLLHDSFGPFHTEIPQYCRRLSITPALLFYKTLLA